MADNEITPYNDAEKEMGMKLLKSPFKLHKNATATDYRQWKTRITAMLRVSHCEGYLTKKAHDIADANDNNKPKVIIQTNNQHGVYAYLLLCVDGNA